MLEKQIVHMKDSYRCINYFTTTYFQFSLYILILSNVATFSKRFCFENVKPENLFTLAYVTSQQTSGQQVSY